MGQSGLMSLSVISNEDAKSCSESIALFDGMKMNEDVQKKVIDIFLARKKKKQYHKKREM